MKEKFNLRMSSRIDIKIGIVGEKNAGKATFLKMLFPSLSNVDVKAYSKYASIYYEAEPRLKKGYTELVNFADSHNAKLDELSRLSEPTRSTDTTDSTDSTDSIDVKVLKNLNIIPARIAKIDRTNNTKGFSLMLLESKLAINILLTVYYFKDNIFEYEDELREMNMIYYIVDGKDTYEKSDIKEYLHSIIEKNAKTGRNTYVQPVINKIVHKQYSQNIPEMNRVDLIIQNIINNGTNNNISKTEIIQEILPETIAETVVETIVQEIIPNVVPDITIKSGLFLDPILLDAEMAIHAIDKLDDIEYDNFMKNSYYNSFKQNFIKTFDKQYREFLLENLRDRIKKVISNREYIADNINHIISVAKNVAKITGIDTDSTMRDVILEYVESQKLLFADKKSIDHSIDFFIEISTKHDVFKQCIPVLEDMRKKYHKFIVDNKIKNYIDCEIMHIELLDLQVFMDAYKEVHIDSIESCREMAREFVKKYDKSMSKYVNSPIQNVENITFLHNILFEFGKSRQKMDQVDKSVISNLSNDTFSTFVETLNRLVGDLSVDFFVSYVKNKILFAIKNVSNDELDLTMRNTFVKYLLSMKQLLHSKQNNMFFSELLFAVKSGLSLNRQIIIQQNLILVSDNIRDTIETYNSNEQICMEMMQKITNKQNKYIDEIDQVDEESIVFLDEDPTWDTSTVVVDDTTNVADDFDIPVVKNSKNNKHSNHNNNNHNNHNNKHEHRIRDNNHRHESSKHNDKVMKISGSKSMKISKKK